MFEDILEVLKELLSQMQKTFNVETVIGEPIIIGDKTIIPIVKMSFGTGGGIGEGGKGEEKGGGGGFGIGGGVEPIALLLVFKDVPGKEGIQLFELKQKGGLGAAIAQIVPKVMEMFGGKAAGKPTEKQEEEKKKLMEI